MSMTTNDKNDRALPAGLPAPGVEPLTAPYWEGTRAGKLVMKAAADTVKKVALELGGKSANILLDDADFPKMVKVGVLTLLMVLPRLVAGAHWISDDLVGGLVLTLLALAWGYCTPLGGVLARWLQKPAEPVLRIPLRLLDYLTRR